MIANQIGYQGEIAFDLTHPDWTVRKLEDVSKTTSLGWTAKTCLKDGLKVVINNYLRCCTYGC